MSEKKFKVTVEIFGDTYTLKSDSHPDKVVQIATFLNERMKKIANANSRLSPAKVAVLAALNITEEYLRLEQDYRQLIQMVKEQKSQ